jgi:thiol:disulfide interchange protein DsbD
MFRRRPKFLPVAIVLLSLAVPLLAHAAGAEPTDFDKARSQGWLWAYLSVFGAGVLTSLTPCVYPMIPIVMGIFGARGENVSRGRAVTLASMYVGGMGLTYAVLGVVVALVSGGNGFGAILANPWVVWPLVAFYTALAASMFGAFEMNLPSGLQQRLSSVGGKGYGGAFAMGMVGGFTAAPCTGPMLLGILTYVATTGSVAVGGTILFTYALGMGILFFAIAIFAISLPKSGRWMEGVKSMAGVALLVMGVYFLRPVVSVLGHLEAANATFLSAAIVLVLVGIVLGAFHLSFHGNAMEKLRKSAGVAFCVIGAAGVLFFFLTPKLKPAWRKRCDDGASAAVQKASQCWTDDQVVLAEARQAKAPVVMDFGATWCQPCRKYETDVFADPEVHKTISEAYVALKFDVSKDTDADRAAQEKYKAETLPTVIIVDKDGKEIRRFGEPIPSPDEFLKALRAARGE